MRKLALAFAAAAAAVVVVIVAIAYLRGGEAPAPTPPDAAVTAPPTSRARARLAELRRRSAGSIAGTVTAAGAPIAAASVCAQPRGEHEPRCTTSDATGSYALAALAPGSYRVWASAPELSGAPWRGPAPGFDEQVAIADGEHRTGIDLVVRAGAVEVRGRVLDVRGRALGGAVVWVRGADPTPVFTTRSTADGEFRAWAMPGEIDVNAAADGHVLGLALGVAPSADVTIVLAPEAVVSGIVVEAGTRRPIGDAEVSIADATARSGADGRFRVSKIPPGRHKPKASSIGGYGEAAESVLLGLRETVDDVVIEVHPVAVVAGRIVIDDGATTEPCPPEHGRVDLRRYSGSVSYSAHTTTGGDVLFEGVEPGVYKVVAACRGFLPRASYPDLTVERSDVEDVVWSVVRGARLTGRVRHRDGTPVADVQVLHVTPQGATGAAVTVADDGTFAFDGLAPGRTEVRVLEGADQLGVATAFVLVALDRVATVELELEPRDGSITGVVVDERGRPSPRTVAVARGPIRRSALTDERGAFAITGLEPGAYDVSTLTTTTWGRPVEGEVAGAMLAAGQIARVRLVTASLEGELAGSVRDARGAPLADVYITAIQLDPERRVDLEDAWRRARLALTVAAVTAADGSFRITGVPRDYFAVRAYREGGGEALAERVATDDRVDLVIRPTGVLAGVVVAADGGAVDDVTVIAHDRRHAHVRRERLFRTGRFALRELPAGTYDLVVDGDDQSAVTVTLAEGGRRDDLRLVARPRFTVRGRLVDPRGAPVSGWHVQAPRFEVPAVALTGVDGRFLLHGLSAGPITISAIDAMRDDATAEPLLELELGATRDVDLGEVTLVGAPAR